MTAEKLKLVDDVMESKEPSVKKISKLAQWFEIDICIKLFGVEIVSWHFPPKDDC